MTDMYRVTSEFGGGPGGSGFNTIYGDSSISSASDFVTLIREFWFTYAADHLSDHVSVTVHGLVELVDPTTGNVTGTTSTGPDSSAGGSAHGDALPWATQGLVQLHTGVYNSGREIRGRIFCPAPTEDDSVNGAPATGYVSSLQDAATLLAESALVVYSPTHHMFASVSAPNVWTQWAVLRSRRD